MDEVIADLEESVDIAVAAGVAHENIWLDPGLVLRKIRYKIYGRCKGCVRISDMGYPVLLGTSRKSLIGNVLGLAG